MRNVDRFAPLPDGRVQLFGPYYSALRNEAVVKSLPTGGRLDAEPARVEVMMSAKEQMETTPKIPLALSKQLRTLAHDLSNSIETIMQASYLLGQATLDDNNKRWVELIDNATRDAARINREIRDILRNQSETS